MKIHQLGITCILLFLLTNLHSFAAIITVNSSGNTYTPNLITITVGDSVRFTITNSHDAREVSQATWNSNGSTALSGGFQTAFGGGLILPAQLGVGTHYYVCTPHANLGMKGRIVVQDLPTSISSVAVQPEISIFPNPATGKLNVNISHTEIQSPFSLEIYDLSGKKVFITSLDFLENTIDLANIPKGIYFVKMSNGYMVLTRKIVII